MLLQRFVADLFTCLSQKIASDQKNATKLIFMEPTVAKVPAMQLSLSQSAHAI